MLSRDSMLRTTAGRLALVLMLLPVTAWVRDAAACGGCLVPEPPPPSEADASTVQTPTVVTDHRIVVALTTQATTLWDQVEYAGEPDEFVWVLPIRGDVLVGVGSDAFIDALDERTTPQVIGPRVFCNPPPQANPAPMPGGGGGGFGGSSSSGDFGCGCGASSSDEASLSPSSFSEDAGASANAEDVGIPDEGVTVSHRSAVGPYETVQIRGDGTESIVTWLRKNKFAIPADIEPILGEYVKEGFGFLVVRLRPNVGVHAMKPIRVSWKGLGVSFPLRLVKAGVASSVGIKLFVIGDGRWRAKNFGNFQITPEELTWDFKQSRSTFTELRDQKAKALDSRAFAMESSIDIVGSSLPTKDDDTVDAGPTAPDAATPTVDSAKSDGDAASTDSAVGDSAVDDAADGDGASDSPALSDAPAVSDAPSVPADTGADTSSLPSFPKDANDVQIAFGTRQERRVTRLRADVPVRHLDQDLVLEADLDQSTIGTRYATAKWANTAGLCTYGVSSVTPASFDVVDEDPTLEAPAGGLEGRPAACTVAEGGTPLRAPLLGLSLLAFVGVVRKVTRRRR